MAARRTKPGTASSEGDRPPARQKGTKKSSAKKAATTKAASRKPRTERRRADRAVLFEAEPGWLPSSLSNEERQTALSRYEEELQRLGQHDPEAAARIRAKRSEEPAARGSGGRALARDLASEQQVDRKQLIPAGLEALSLLQRLLFQVADRNAVLPHERDFAEELIAAAARFSEALDVWRERTWVARLSRDLDQTQLSPETSAADAQAKLLEFCQKHDLVPDPDRRERAVLGAARKLSRVVGPDVGGPKKARQRALAQLLFHHGTEGASGSSIAKFEALSGLESTRIDAPTFARDIDTREAVEAAVKRLQQCARQLVLEQAIETGVDIAGLLALPPGDTELHLRARARGVPVAPSFAPTRDLNAVKALMHPDNLRGDRKRRK